MALPATPPDKMSFWEHLQELRVRIVRSLLIVAVCFAVTYAFRFKLWAWAQKPFLEAMARQTGKPIGALDPFAFTDLTEPFFSMMRLSLWSAAVLCAPFLFYQLWAFIRPGLLPKERRLVIPFVFVTSGCFLAGAAFAVRWSEGVVLIPLCAWTAWKFRSPRKVFAIAGGFALGTLLCAGITDWLTWGTPFRSLWEFFRIMFLERKGVEDQPVWEYPYTILHWAGPVFVLLLIPAWKERRARLARLAGEAKVGVTVDDAQNVDDLDRALEEPGRLPAHFATSSRTPGRSAAASAAVLFSFAVAGTPVSPDGGLFTSATLPGSCGARYQYRATAASIRATTAHFPWENGLYTGWVGGKGGVPARTAAIMAGTRPAGGSMSGRFLRCSAIHSSTGYVQHSI